VRTRAASVFSGDDDGCTILTFGVPAIESVVGFALTKHSLHAFNRKLLMSVRVGGGQLPLLEGLNDKQTEWLLDALIESTLPVGSVVIKEGNLQEGFQIVKRGEVTVSSKEKGVVSTLGVGCAFGETSLGGNPKPRRTSVTCSGDEPAILLLLHAQTIRDNGDFDGWREKLTTPPKSAGKGAKSGAKSAGPLTTGRKPPTSRVAAQSTNRTKLKASDAGIALSVKTDMGSTAKGASPPPASNRNKVDAPQASSRKTDPPASNRKMHR